MVHDYGNYESPLSRYVSKDMSFLFSARHRWITVHQIWAVNARCQNILAPEVVTKEQFLELWSMQDIVDFDRANIYEAETHHDVVAHIKAFGDHCPTARPIIHLGMTSCSATDNADLIILRQALSVVHDRLVGVIYLLAQFVEKTASLPVLGSTHGQPATPVTLGKRFSLYLQGFMEGVRRLEAFIPEIKFLGCRGATGTSEAMLKVFGGDAHKVKQLDEMMAEFFHFSQVYPVSGQTYPRDLDAKALNILSEIAITAHKMATDIRLLQRSKEIEEPFAETQVGSSAMPYKRNPMRCERICSLARVVQGFANMATVTADLQWLERTLDDSAGRRIYLPEAFLAIDGILLTCANVVDGLVLCPGSISKNFAEELPFMAVEDLIALAVSKGGDRQDTHEIIRQLAMEASYNVKINGGKNDLVERLLASDKLDFTQDDIDPLLDPSRLVGLCEYQVQTYLADEIKPFLELPENKEIINQGVNSTVSV